MNHKLKTPPLEKTVFFEEKGLAPDGKNLKVGLFSAGLATLLFLCGGFFSPPIHQNRADAFSATGCEGDCTQCHSINNQEIKSILQSMKIPQAEVLKIQMSPIKGLWEISINERGKQGLFYVDFSKKYLLPGPIIEIQGGVNKTMERLGKIQESGRVDFAKIPMNNALVMGNALAPQKVAVFTDPDCPFCRTLHHELEKVIQERRDIAFYIFLYPLMMHKNAYWKSKSILCNKSLKMLTDAFLQKPIPRTECDTQEIDANIKLAETLGISSTPTLVFADGRVHKGTVPASQLIDLILGKR